MKVREPTRSAGKGWHVVTIVQQTREILSIHKIIEVTDFGSRTGKPIADGKYLAVDCDSICHVFQCRYLMDPQGKLYDGDGKLVADSVHELDCEYRSWRNALDQKHRETFKLRG